MIRFDPSKLSVEIVYLKSVTTAVGGSITVMKDPEDTSKTGTTRIVVPMAVARAFIQVTNKITRYLKPALTALVWYDNRIVAMERHPLGSMGLREFEGIDGKLSSWQPHCVRNIDTLKSITSGEWHFDGRYVYSFDQTIERAIHSATFLTASGQFRKLAVQSFDVQSIGSKDWKAETSARSCVAFVASNGMYSVSPPIWKDIASIAGAAKKSTDDSDEDDDDIVSADLSVLTDKFAFDLVDSSYHVNLNFALSAGTQIGKEFGYEYVEPLQLPRLMIELHTVNLPAVSLDVKRTYDIGISFTHAMAWLLGLQRCANTLDTYLMMRTLLKYLTQKGIFRNNLFSEGNILKEGMTLDDVKQIPLADLTTISSTDLHTLLSSGSMRLRKKKASDLHHQIGGLLNEE